MKLTDELIKEIVGKIYIDENFHPEYRSGYGIKAIEILARLRRMKEEQDKQNNSGKYRGQTMGQR